MKSDDMERIPESELMEDPAQARAYADADFSEPHNAFVAHFQRLFPAFSSGEVVDLGCGAADVTIRFASAYPAARITGVDGAQAMLDLGLKAVDAAGLSRNITLEKRRLPGKLPQRFDVVISNSLLHHLDSPNVLWQTVKQAAKPGAPVLVIDLLRPASKRQAQKLVALHAAEAPALLRRDFYNSLLAAYQPDEIRGQLDETGLQSFIVEVVSDRHVMIWGKAQD